VYFYFHDATIRLDMKAVLQSNSDCVNNRQQNVVIEGHADERGTDEYNMALGEKRARGIKRYLQKLGVSNAVRTLSYGEERPVCTDTTSDCWWRNRRAEFQFE